MNFEWDLAKELENIRKHGVSFAEAVEAFWDPDGFALSDVAHSEIEKRFYWIGMSNAGRVLTTRYTRRRENIRIFGSAEWRKFRRMYETAKNQRPEEK